MTVMKIQFEVLWLWWRVVIWQDTDVSEDLTASSPPKLWYPAATPHGVTTQKISSF